MITTVWGHNNKKNKAPYLVAQLAGMNSMTKGTKNLIIQLTNPDYESIENILGGFQNDIGFVKTGMTIESSGIDAIIRSVEGGKMTISEFEQTCLPLRSGNRLDVTEITKNTQFTNLLENKLKDISLLLQYAKEVYDDIFVLLPSDAPDIVKKINEMPLIDRKILCMSQGHYLKGEQIEPGTLIVVPDYDPDSKFSLKGIQKEFRLGKKNPVRSIERNVQVFDAIKSQNLLMFISENRDLSPYDINYKWSNDVKNILLLLNGKAKEEMPVNYEWEKTQPWTIGAYTYKDVLGSPNIIRNVMSDYFTKETVETEERSDLSEKIIAEVEKEEVEEAKEENYNRYFDEASEEPEMEETGAEEYSTEETEQEEPFKIMFDQDENSSEEDTVRFEEEDSQSEDEENACEYDFGEDEEEENEESEENEFLVPPSEETEPEENLPTEEEFLASEPEENTPEEKEDVEAKPELQEEMFEEKEEAEAEQPDEPEGEQKREHEQTKPHNIVLEAGSVIMTAENVSFENEKMEDEEIEQLLEEVHNLSDLERRSEESPIKHTVETEKTESELTEVERFYLKHGVCDRETVLPENQERKNG